MAHEFMGKVTVVNFYSIQCPIQRAWDGRLAIQKEFESQGVVFLHIDSNVTEIGEEAPSPTASRSPTRSPRAPEGRGPAVHVSPTTATRSPVFLRGEDHARRTC